MKTRIGLFFLAVVVISCSENDKSQGSDSVVSAGSSGSAYSGSGTGGITIPVVTDSSPGAPDSSFVGVTTAGSDATSSDSTSTTGTDGSVGTSTIPAVADSGKTDAALDDSAVPLDGAVTLDAEPIAQVDATSEPAPRADLGEGDGSDVITIGDSWMSLVSTGIQQSLVRISGQPYRTYGVPGTRLLNGQIPGQYEAAKRADPDIKTVVMTGGGNDILMTGLQEDCANGGSACAAQLELIAEGLVDLWAQMSQDGVMDVVYIRYASSAGSGAQSTAIADGCANVPEPMRCHLLPTTDIVNNDIRSDGIHPTDAAYDRIAQAVYDLMLAEGMRR